MFERALFVFRRDLRLQDNTGLIHALENAKEVVCIFVFTPEQLDNNPYRSDSCVQFMLESLEDLEEELAKKGGRLFYFFDSQEKAVAACIKKFAVDLVVVNRDYTPYSLHRDKKIAKVCQDASIAFHSCDDLLLHKPDALLKSNGDPYTVFTPFYRHASKLHVEVPKRNLHANYVEDGKDQAVLFKKILPIRRSLQKGGRREALKILGNLGRFSHYLVDRDFPSQSATTHLSPHLKFTTVSAREVYHKIKDNFNRGHPLIRSLYWRDFFTLIGLHFPRVFEGAFHEKFDNLHWDSHSPHFKKWCEGKTGFPIVDAGMRELLQTGNMHNRVRMIVASFLVKDLHIHWQKGEKFFAQHLIDYDPAVNNGNWQWVASTGCDAQPYFRIFNPWLQQAKFDPHCEYIKKWVPELEGLDAKVIHRWYTQEKTTGYPLPIVDHSVEAKKALADYKRSARMVRGGF